MSGSKASGVTVEADPEEISSTNVVPIGDRGSPEYAQLAAHYLAYASEDIYADIGPEKMAHRDVVEAHVRINDLQASCAYARDVLAALAADPELLAKVEEAMAAQQAAPGPR